MSLQISNRHYAPESQFRMMHTITLLRHDCSEDVHNYVEDYGEELNQDNYTAFENTHTNSHGRYRRQCTARIDGVPGVRSPLPQLTPDFSI